MKSELRVALLGQGFMGKAHSNAYCQARAFLRPPVPHPADAALRPRRRVARGDGGSAGAGKRRPPTGAPPSTARTSTPSTSRCRTICTRRPRLPRREAGKIVLCEKPLALTRRRGARDGRRRRAACATLVWFNYRRVPAIAYARQLIDEGRLGTIFHYNAAYKQQWGADTSRAGDLEDGSGAGRVRRRRTIC